MPRDFRINYFIIRTFEELFEMVMVLSLSVIILHDACPPICPSR